MQIVKYLWLIMVMFHSGLHKKETKFGLFTLEIGEAVDLKHFYSSSACYLLHCKKVVAKPSMLLLKEHCFGI